MAAQVLLSLILLIALVAFAPLPSLSRHSSRSDWDGVSYKVGNLAVWFAALCIYIISILNECDSRKCLLNDLWRDLLSRT